MLQDEIRNPNIEIRNKSEIRRKKNEPGCIAMPLFFSSVFGFVSDFGFRVSDLRFRPILPILPTHAATALDTSP